MKWVGFEESEATWEAISHICADAPQSLVSQLLKLKGPKDTRSALRIKHGIKVLSSQVFCFWGVGVSICGVETLYFFRRMHRISAYRASRYWSRGVVMRSLCERDDSFLSIECS